MKTGRNDPCPCGSGKKYKHCCLNSNIIPFPGGNMREEAIGPEAGGQGTEEFDPDIMARMIGFSSASGLDSAMAEYTEYCENVPPEAYVPPFREFQGQPNEASAALNSLKADMAGMNFSSFEEAEAYAAGRVEEWNREGRAEFLGLSPEQIQNILYSDYLFHPDYVSVSGSLQKEDIENTPIMARAMVFLDLLTKMAGSSGSMPITASGYLKPEFCRQYYNRVTGEDFSKSWMKIEADYQDISVMKFILDEIGCIDIMKTRCGINDAGRALLSGSGLTAAFMEMLQFYIDELDWEYGAGSIPYEPFEIYQESVLFSLYILHKKGYKPRSRREYFDFFRKTLLRDLPKDNEILMAVYVTMYEKLIIEDFFARFGLVDLGYQPESLPDEVKNTERIIKPTPLFKKLFKWKI